MANASRDQNYVTTMLAVSSSDGSTPVTLYADPSTHRLLVSGSGGSGTVTSVSVVSANGLSGSVATATTTPAITLSTTITGILKGNGTAISAASAGTDYEVPLTFSTGLTRTTNTITSNISTGVSGGQTILGGTAANDDLTIRGTSNATKTTSYVLLQDTGGSVGIGTVTPTCLLDVTAADAGTTLTSASAAMLVVTNTNTTVNNFSDVSFAQADSSSNIIVDSKIAGVHTVHTNGATSGEMAFLTRSAGTIAEVARFKSNGTMTMGGLTINPANGGITLNQTFAVKITTANALILTAGTGDPVSILNFNGNSVIALRGSIDDLFLRRDAAAFLRFGAADVAAPVAQTLGVQNVVTGTSNTAGVNLTVNGSIGTGTGTGGSILFATAPAGGSGTSQNALVTALTIAGSGLVTTSGGLTVIGTTTLATSLTGPLRATSGVVSAVTNATIPYAGSFSQVGAATTVFTVTIGTTQANATYKVNVTPTATLSAAFFYVTNKTTTTFDVTYLAGLTGTVTFDWAVFP